MALSFEEIYNACSQFGIYNIILIMALGLLYSYSAMCSLASNFLTAHEEHWCRIPPLEHLPDDVQRQLAIPWNNDVGAYESCLMYDVDWSNVSSDIMETWNGSDVASVISCQNGWTFDQSVFTSTVQMEFSVVCEQAWLGDLVGPSYVMGFGLGACICGYIANRLGRRRSILLGIAGCTLSGTLAAFAPDIYVFLAARFFVAVSIINVYVVANILLLEVTPRRYSGMAGVIYQCFYPIGTFLLTGCAYYIRNFRFLQLIIALLAPVFLLYHWLLPRSPRWLLWRGDQAGAVKELVRMARYNRLEIPQEILHEGYTYQMRQVTPQVETKRETSSGGYSDIYRRPRVLKYVAAVTVVWLNFNFTYSAVSFNLDGLFGDVYTNTVLSGVFELPAALLAYLTLNRRGRRVPLYLFNIIMAVAALVALPILIFDIQELEIITTISAICCRSCAFGGAICLYIYVMELFPTCLRNQAISIASSLAYLITVSAPFVAGSLSESFEPLPYIVYATLSVLSVCSIYILPETHNQTLPETTQDLINFNRSDATNPSVNESQVATNSSLPCDEVITMTAGVDNMAFAQDKTDKEGEKCTTTVVDILNEAGISFISEEPDLSVLPAVPFMGLISRQSSIASGIPNVSIAFPTTDAVSLEYAAISNESDTCDEERENAPSSVENESQQVTSCVSSGHYDTTQAAFTAHSGADVVNPMPDPERGLIEGEFPGSLVIPPSNVVGRTSVEQLRVSRDSLSWEPRRVRFGYTLRQSRPQRSTHPELLTYTPLHSTLLLP